MNIKFSKVVSSLPGTLEANTLYIVRIGVGFDLYVTNSSGGIVAYPLNSTGGGGTQVSVGETNGLTGEGIWIETGLGNDGKDFTFWFEDGL